MKHPQSRCLVLWISAALAVILGAGCNAVFEIHEGTPRLLCADSQLIDDLEDGDWELCKNEERDGEWWHFGDNTPGGKLKPPADGRKFTPTRVEDGSRGLSQYAARISGSGFTNWGALLGLNLTNGRGYNVLGRDAVSFWMKSKTPVIVTFATAETVPISDGGTCDEIRDKPNCNNHFGFEITHPADDWFEYHVPFDALRQLQIGGSAIWNPRNMINIQFSVPAIQAFDLWIDDLRFSPCGDTCEPTCTDPALPKACRAFDGPRSSCQPEGTDCEVVADWIASWCADPLVIDDLEDANGQICASGEREGWWFTLDFSTGVFEEFRPTLLPAARDTSSYAAQLSGNGLVGFNLLKDQTGDQGYDASTSDGIAFWMKSPVPIWVDISLSATTPVEYDGTCVDCNVEDPWNNFKFEAASTGNEWVQVKVPFAALRREAHDSDLNWVANPIAWDATRLRDIRFVNDLGVEAWIDDVRFYSCEAADNCVPTCGTQLPIACPRSDENPPGCWPSGTDCAKARGHINSAVSGTSPDDVWVVGTSPKSGAATLSHWNGSEWTLTVRDDLPGLRDVWGGAELWAVGEHGSTARHEDAEWTLFSDDTGTSGPLAAIWGSSPEDMWAVATSILHFDGETWSVVENTASDSPLFDVWGSASDDVWATGMDGTLIHWDGIAWSSFESGTDSNLNAVWGADSDDVWAVGEGGAVTHWDGTDWTLVSADSAMSLAAVWGSGTADVWAVGEFGTLLHWDGTVWAPSESPTGSALNDVWGSGPADVWAVGEFGVIVHWDGSNWSASPQ